MGDLNSDQFFCSNAQPQGSHPGSKQCKFLTPGLLLLVKKTRQMIKCPCHGQTCNIKSPSYARPPPERLNIDRCIIIIEYIYHLPEVFKDTCKSVTKYCFYPPYDSLMEHNCVQAGALRFKKKKTINLDLPAGDFLCQ